MVTSWLIIAGGAIGVLLAAWLVRHFVVTGGESDAPASRASGPIPVTRNTPRKHKAHFFGATMMAGPYACDAAKKLDGQRYLTGEGPQFPLPDCDRKECRCRLAPQDDRRAGYDRRGDSFSAYGDYMPDRYAQKRRDPSDRRDD